MIDQVSNSNRLFGVPPVAGHQHAGQRVDQDAPLPLRPPEKDPFLVRGTVRPPSETTFPMVVPFTGIHLVAVHRAHSRSASSAHHAPLAQNQLDHYIIFMAQPPTTEASILLRLPFAMLTDIDAARGRTPRIRWIRDAIAAKLPPKIKKDQPDESR